MNHRAPCCSRASRRLCWLFLFQIGLLPAVQAAPAPSAATGTPAPSAATGTPEPNTTSGPTPVFVAPLATEAADRVLRTEEPSIRAALTARLLATGRFQEAASKESERLIREYVARANRDLNEESSWVDVSRGQGARLLVNGRLAGNRTRCTLTVRLLELETRLVQRMHHDELAPCSTVALDRVMEQAAAVLAGQPAGAVATGPAALERSLGEALQQLVREAVPAGKSVVVYNIRYEDRELPSPLGRYLEGRILERVVADRLFPVFPRAKLDQAARERGTALGDLRGLALELALTGTFFEDATGVNLFLKVVDAASLAPRAVRSLHLARSWLPEGLAAAPAADQSATAQSVLRPLVETGAGSGLKVEVAPDRGRGTTYAVGEEMVVVVKANRDCYVKVFMVQADQTTVLLFPNRFDQQNRLVGGRVRLLGSQGDSFKFTVSPPFGLEALKLVASTRQFDDYPELLRRFQGGQDFDALPAGQPAAAAQFVKRGLTISAQAGRAELAEDSSAYVVVP